MNIRMNYTTREEGERTDKMPVVPLPNIGEGGAVAPVPPPIVPPTIPTIPTIPTGPSIPAIPLPNPGEGGGVGVIPTPGNVGGIITTIVTTYPRPNAPCNFCTIPTNKTGQVRFLNAASDYGAFRVYVKEQLFVQPFYYGEVSDYQKVESGYQTITISGENGYVYIQDSVMIPENGDITIAIVNTTTGLGLTVIEEGRCNSPSHTSCVRVCNLSHNSGDLDVIIGNSYVTFENVSFQETTAYQAIWPDRYYFYVSKSNQRKPVAEDKYTTVLLSSQITIGMNKNYTIYLFKWENGNPNAVRAIIVEE